jgi:predicted ATPase
MFEQGARPHPPRELYRAYVSQSDVFIGLYWQRYGQPATGASVSGLEEEFNLSERMPRLVYVKVPAPDREPRLVDLLRRVRDQASYRSFTTAAELSRLVRDDLASLLSERFAAGSTPAPAEAATGPGPLPAETTSLIGRAADIDAVVQSFEQQDGRFVTLTGPGGIGKTRLALAVGEGLRDRFDAGTAFVSLATTTEASQAISSIGRAVGVDLTGVGSALDALVDQFAGGRWLLILDNLEQLQGVAAPLDQMLAACPGLAILATSRAVIGLRAEREYPVPPLAMPADAADLPVAELASVPAVALFVDRARSAQHDFQLTADNAASVVEIVRRLEGLPLAIELAAARTRLLDPDGLLGRLVTSLDALGTGTADMPERQRTLRATVEWSVNLLDDDTRAMLEALAVFVDGWSIDAAAAVAGIDENSTLDITDGLIQHSLVRRENTAAGPRYGMLETIRAFVAQRLEERSDLPEIQRRHAHYYGALVEQADVHLRGTDYQWWVERLHAESGNLGAAVRWYRVHDPAKLPHMFRILFPFWELRDHLGETLAWIDDLLPQSGSFDPESQAELLTIAAMGAAEAGDDAMVLSAHDRLVAAIAPIQDPLLHALSLLAIAWTSPIRADFDRAAQAAAAGLDEMRRLDEPFWTAVAAGTMGNLEMQVRHNEEAIVHLGEFQDRSDVLGNAWMSSWSRAHLAIVAVAQGRIDDAHTLLDDSLRLSSAAHSIRGLVLALSTAARLALVEGDPERAATLAGAAGGLRRRAMLRTWPASQRVETELLSEIRAALGTERFDESTALGARLNQRDALAMATTH